MIHHQSSYSMGDTLQLTIDDVSLDLIGCLSGVTSAGRERERGTIHLRLCVPVRHGSRFEDTKVERKGLRVVTQGLKEVTQRLGIQLFLR